MSEGNKKRKHVTGKAIAQNYWDKLNKDGTYNTPVNPRHVWVDFGEPRCMGCGLYKNAKYVDVRPDEDTEKKWLNCWNRATAGKYAYLQKCHIIPHCYEGDDSLDNFILLCKKCHNSNPNTSSVEMYQKWLDNIKPWDRYEEASAGLWEAMDLYEVEQEQCLEAMNHPDFSDFYIKNSVQVVGEGNNWNTRIAVVAMFLKELNNKELCKA